MKNTKLVRLAWGEMLIWGHLIFGNINDLFAEKNLKGTELDVDDITESTMNWL